MATLLTDISNAEAGTNWRTAALPNTKDKTRKSQLTATYTCTGAEAAGAIINVASLPRGAVLVADECVVANDGLGGTSGTITKLGDAGDDDRYSATAIAITAAGIVAVTSTTAQAVAPYVIAAGNEIIKATVGLASGAFTAGKKLTFRLIYLMP